VLGRSPAAASPALTPFVDPLPVPAVAAPRNVVPGADFYEMRLTEFTHRFHRDLPPTTVWGYAGTSPGPTLVARRNRPVLVRWVNDLRDGSGQPRTAHYLPVVTCNDGPDRFGAAPRTVVHLHGGRVPPGSDGYPEATILPGQHAVFLYPNSQRAATLWYHDHAMGITRLNVYMGLAGFYLIRDPLVEGPLNLPAGEFEVPLVLQDRSFNPDGSLDYPAVPYSFIFAGDVATVNGAAWPYLDVKRGKYRFRLLNGSNQRTYTLALSSGAPLLQIGTDQGLLPAPLSLPAITLMPAERADVIVDFAGHAPGDTVRLLNNDADTPPLPELLEFRVGSAPGHVAPVPASLCTITPLNPALAVQTRDIVLNFTPDPCAGFRLLLNGKGFHEIDEFPQLGTIEIWRFHFDAVGFSHPIHMHLVQFQVLGRRSLGPPEGPLLPPAANEMGWKDTVQVPGGQITEVIARFDGYTGRYPYHCHILEHEDNDMMRQFEVIP
jgi:spore coat protein A